MDSCPDCQYQAASLQLTANCDIKRSGEPSRLSLSRQWIFRRAFPNDIDNQDRSPSAVLLYQHKEPQNVKQMMCVDEFEEVIYVETVCCLHLV